MHKWYDWVHYHEPTDVNRQLLGRYLGPAHIAGQGYAHYVLSAGGKVKPGQRYIKLMQLHLSQLIFKTNNVASPRKLN